MTAIEIAIEALRRGHLALRNHEISDFEAVERAYSEISQALAALTAEPSPVPPDRERNTGLVCDAESYLRQTGQTVYAGAVASLLRQPAPAEVEAQRSWEGAAHEYEEQARFARAERDKALAKIDALRKALEPFAAYAGLAAREHPGWDHDEFKVPVPDYVFRMAVFRAARSLLSEGGRE